MIYQDDIEFLAEYSEKKFPRIFFMDGISKEELIKRTTTHWASNYVIIKCWDRVGSDPLDVLESVSNEYQIESIFGIQNVNRKNYNDAMNVVEDMRLALLKRRGLVQ